jgi:hypothetical protein
VKKKAYISTIDYDLQNVPIIHPKDSILAICHKDVKRPLQIGQYFVLCRLDDGKKTIVKKEVGHQFLKDNLDPLYMEYFNNFINEKGWFCLKDGGELITVDDDDDVVQLRNSLEPFYEFVDPKNGVLILAIKIVIKFEWGTEDELDNNNVVVSTKQVLVIQNIKWFVKCEKYEGGKYVPVDYDFLMVNTYDKFVTNLQEQAIILANEEFVNKAIIEKRRKYIEKYDNFNKEDIGDIDKDQTYYFSCSKKGYKFDTTSKQISRLKYVHEKNKWIGVETENCDTAKDGLHTVVLPNAWVEFNFLPEHVALLKEQSFNNNNKFLRVPVGDMITIKPTMIILGNPIIKYKNNEKGICAFAALSSTLHFLGYNELSKLIYSLSYHDHKDFNKNHLNIIQQLNNFIYKNADFINFRRKYKCVKLDSHCNIFSLMLKKDEILLLCLIQSDNNESHCVCVCKGFIFDSNADNALPFTKEGIDCCCGENDNYKGICNGYYIKLNRFKLKT